MTCLYTPSEFDLYTKSDSVPNIDELMPYYQSLIDKYIPGTIRWWFWRRKNNCTFLIILMMHRIFFARLLLLAYMPLIIIHLCKCNKLLSFCSRKQIIIINYIHATIIAFTLPSGWIKGKGKRCGAIVIVTSSVGGGSHFIQY